MYKESDVETYKCRFDKRKSLALALQPEPEDISTRSERKNR